MEHYWYFIGVWLIVMPVYAMSNFYFLHPPHALNRPSCTVVCKLLIVIFSILFLLPYPLSLQIVQIRTRLKWPIPSNRGLIMTR